MADKDIVEDSYYDHAEHGTVRVVDVSDGEVSMEITGASVVIGSRSIPAGARQDADGFRRDAEPADVSASADAAEFDLTGVTQ